eukprot:CAMPEP_0178895794 /NCGR_PEP_ID=MMETSP0786-20121207/788_1 /TAXON_ID=186022 /ORGANISM="Thalassionema frauenfeldii, Strain CCMP 1798" /LENGTH=196 /DNA_ID=CAMNT_0020566071 /DNA_START=225 /DNA_END=812 /DNA_ORIENTATION=+
MAHQRAASLLVAWLSFRLMLLRRKRRRTSASKMAAHYRRYRQQRRYRLLIAAVVRIQTVQRRIAAKARVQKLRDPYGEYSFQEMKALLKKEQSRLQGLVEDKLYTAAARLEPKIEILKAEVEKKRPLTRTWLEEQISEVQSKLDDAVSRKAYPECGPLQEELASLQEKRNLVPTLEELKERIEQAQGAVADAIAAK